MANETITIINYLTEDLIRICSIPTPTNNINNVVSMLGGCVEEGSNIYSSLKKLNDRFVIYVPSSYSVERKRFAIAQELGHLFLHMGYIVNPELWDRQKNMNHYESKCPLEEYQANEFAKALLMPKDVYEEVMEHYTIGNRVKTAKIAEYFGVSVSIAYSRGKSLGLLA